MHFPLQHMLTSAFLTTAVSSAAISLRNVQFAAATGVEKRDDMAAMTPRFKFCREKDFVDCITFDPIETRVCYNLPTNWNNVCTSVQTLDGLTCAIWDEAGCNGSGVYFTGSISDLATVGMDNKSTSFDCWYA